MESMERNLIYIAATPLTIKIKELFFLEIFEQAGYRVEYWSLHRFYHPAMRLPDELNEPGYVILDTPGDLKRRLSLYDPSRTYIIYTLDFVYLYRHLFDLVNRAGFRISSIFPYSGISHIQLSRQEKLRRVFSSNIIKKIPEFLKANVLFKCYCRTHGLQLSQHYFSSSFPRTDAINHPDYESYMKLKNSPDRVVEGPYAVFLDIYFPLHPDLVLMAGWNTAEPALYQKSLRDFFDKLEALLQMPVVVAAHPKATYDHSEMGNRRVIKYKTNELVRDASLVISHLSTSTSYAVLYDKPVLFVTCTEMAKYSKFSFRLEMYARRFGKKVYNIDTEDPARMDRSAIEPLFRESYKYTYLTTPSTENLSNREILLEAYERLFSRMEEENPLVSVLMPVYNAQKYVAQAIESVLSQTYRHFELVLIDDGSTDGSVDIIRSFHDRRIVFVENPGNLKIIATLNRGIELCRGKYIARMDADDVCMPDRLEKQVRYLEQNPQVALCGSWVRLTDAGGKITGRVRNAAVPELVRISLLFSVPFVHPSVMMRAAIVKEFRYSPHALHCEDYDLWLRLAAHNYPMANIPEYLLHYRWHSENISQEKNEEQTRQKNILLRPYLEFYMKRALSDDDMVVHTASFRLYRFGSRKEKAPLSLTEQRNWFLLLLKQNKKNPTFNPADMEAFLWSRWIVCCLYRKKPYMIFHFPVKWYLPRVSMQTLRLLMK